MDKPLSPIEHLEELRKRLIVSLIAIFVFSIICWFFSKKIIFFIAKPIERLVFLSPQEPFFAYLKISFICGFFLALPLLVYEIWKFVSIGLTGGERRYFLRYMPLFFIALLTGASFAYFIVLPVGIKFLLRFGTEKITPMISINNYISFFGAFILAFAGIFELPLVSLFLAKLGIITPELLAKKRAYAVIAVLIIAAILTPPDVLTQLFLALPMIVLYEISIWLTRLATTRHRRLYVRT
jgi:sec-independent protein translocase protein TatC